MAQGTLTATNYAFSLTNNTLEVTPAALTATADDQSRAYGAVNPVLTISYSGFVNGEDTNVLTTLPSAGTTANNLSGTGAYPITLSGGSATNYVFTLVPGTLTVTQAMLTATADDQSPGLWRRPIRC